MKNKVFTALNDNEALTPEELIKKHNANPEHLISDNEMKNLKIGDKAVSQDELIRKIQEKEAEDNCNKHENNSYDIFDA